MQWKPWRFGAEKRYGLLGWDSSTGTVWKQGNQSGSCFSNPVPDDRSTDQGDNNGNGAKWMASECMLKNA